MNDFTKEELEHLATLFKFTEVAYPDFKLNEDLWVKIESMIDNYCEHKETEMDCDGGISLVCTKCGETIMDVM